MSHALIGHYQKWYLHVGADFGISHVIDSVVSQSLVHLNQDCQSV